MPASARSGTRYTDRREAGRTLAEHLAPYAGRGDVVVLGLPRGGIPVAYEVASAIRAPLDVFVVRKLGLPGHPEYAMGAIASGGIRVLNDIAISESRVPASVVDAVARSEEIELERRERAYRGARPAVPLAGRVVMLIDDGLATGSTMRAAVLAVRRREPSTIIVAVPVGARDTVAVLAQIADDVVCPMTPEPFTAVGLWYDDFGQTTDEEVRRLLAASSPGHRAERGA